LVVEEVHFTPDQTMGPKGSEREEIAQELDFADMIGAAQRDGGALGTGLPIRVEVRLPQTEQPNAVSSSQRCPG